MKQGLNAIALFPHISNSKKDDKGTHAFAHDNIICTSIKKINQEYPHLGIICDVALDPTQVMDTMVLYPMVKWIMIKH